MLGDGDILKHKLQQWKTNVENDKKERGVEDKTIWSELEAKEVD